MFERPGVASGSSHRPLERSDGFIAAAQMVVQQPQMDCGKEHRGREVRPISVMPSCMTSKGASGSSSTARRAWAMPSSNRPSTKTK